MTWIHHNIKTEAALFLCKYKVLSF